MGDLVCHLLREISEAVAAVVLSRGKRILLDSLSDSFVPSMAAPLLLSGEVEVDTARGVGAAGWENGDIDAAAAGRLGLGGAVVESTPTAAVVAGVDTIGDVERVDEMA